MRGKASLSALILGGILAMTASVNNEKVKRPMPGSPIGLAKAGTENDVEATINYHSDTKKCSQTVKGVKNDYPPLVVGNKDTISWKGQYDGNDADEIEVEFPPLAGLTKLGTPLRYDPKLDLVGREIPLYTLQSDKTTKATPAVPAVDTAVGDFSLAFVKVTYKNTGYVCKPDLNGMQPFGVHVQQ